ncbi:DUF6153 family protein [Pseudolysinimonas sp.]|uniref:DUF6153 family protein n=1 Tax=Pseudolysinimonas sp. TaxID=2680009 RepID=UPI00286D3FF2|nr:DUF6153 family protein [Pseudolysinimonas sp.]
MKTIRSLASTRSTMHRLFFLFGVAVALIAGLLAMHTLTANSAHIESAPALLSAADLDQVMVAGANEDMAGDARHCMGDCGAPANMPDHSILMMVCALALLAAVIIVLPPALLARFGMSLGVAALIADVPRALPRPRPPSLLVLSISRT